jgi:hypothetical protein
MIAGCAPQGTTVIKHMERKYAGVDFTYEGKAGHVYFCYPDGKINDKDVVKVIYDSDTKTYSDTYYGVLLRDIVSKDIETNAKYFEDYVHVFVDTGYGYYSDSEIRGKTYESFLESEEPNDKAFRTHVTLVLPDYDTVDSIAIYDPEDTEPVISRVLLSTLNAEQAAMIRRYKVDMISEKLKAAGLYGSYVVYFVTDDLFAKLNYDNYQDLLFNGNKQYNDAISSLIQAD